MSLIIREIQIRTTLRHYLLSVRMACIYIYICICKTRVVEDVEKLKAFHTIGGDRKWYSCYG